MGKLARDIAPRVEGNVTRLRDRILLEGAMATAALVALADERLSIEETLAVKLVLENARLLRLHDPEDAVGLYTGFVDALRTDRAAGRRRALEAVARCSQDIEAAELIVNVGVAVANADRDFSREEVRMIEEICSCVGISGLDALSLAGSPSAKVH